MALRQASKTAWERGAAALESWLSARVDGQALVAAERARQERFVASRTAVAALALAALPPALLLCGVPTILGLFALVALVAPLAATALMARMGGLAAAQAASSAALALFLAALALALGGARQPALFLLLLAVPVEAAFAGLRSALIGLPIAAAAITPTALILQTEPDIASRVEATALGFAVALILAIGHAFAALSADSRLKALLREANRAGDAREGAAVEALDDLLTWHDRAGSVLRASPSAARLLRVRPSSLQGRGFFARVHVADRPAFLKAIDDAAAGAEPVCAWLRLAVGVGEEDSRGPVPHVWIEMRAYRLKGMDGPRVLAVSRAMPDGRREAPGAVPADPVPPPIPLRIPAGLRRADAA